MVSFREIKELSTLMCWRKEVIEHVFGQKADERLLAANSRYYGEHISDGSHLAFILDCDGVECGCGAVCFTDELPSPDNLSGKCAYLMNVYVREPFRRHGLAHKIVSRLIEESKRRGCGKIYLETTDEGKPVYSSLGFREMPDMMIYYDTET